MSVKDDILSEFQLFRGGGGGIESWFSESMPDVVAETIENCRQKPISCAILNQLLILCHEAGISQGFFNYYFCSDPHARGALWYDPKKLPEFDPIYVGASAIRSKEQLKWGLRRLYIDGLLHFGNIRQAYRTLRGRSEAEIDAIIARNTFDTGALLSRGAPLSLSVIAKDDRYLIAELACKTYEPPEGGGVSLIDFMRARYVELKQQKKEIKFRDLIVRDDEKLAYTKGQLEFSVDEVIENEIENEDDLINALTPIIEKFQRARGRALTNTSLYLSMISDMDVYVATSMRSRRDFRNMADLCESTFGASKLLDLNLRYFDPTLSAARNHEDKGLIECLMVKCAKMLVYTAGATDSYGKAVEAAMALSLGKPVIFYCDEAGRHNFYREVHPLSRLINVETGVAVGAIVTDDSSQVVELISRIFRNDMEFDIIKKADNYFLLVEKLTNSTVRLQTNDTLINETFWNYYHGQKPQAH